MTLMDVLLALVVGAVVGPLIPAWVGWTALVVMGGYLGGLVLVMALMFSYADEWWLRWPCRAFLAVCGVGAFVGATAVIRLARDGGLCC